MVAVATLLIERLTIRPLINENFLSIVTITLGLEFLIANLSINFFGGRAESLRIPGDIQFKNFEIGGVRFNWWHVVILISTFIILAIVGYIVNRTELGLAMRAFAEDKDAARLMGIKESTVSQWDMDTFRNSRRTSRDTLRPCAIPPARLYEYSIYQRLRRCHSWRIHQFKRWCPRRIIAWRIRSIRCEIRSTSNGCSSSSNNCLLHSSYQATRALYPSEST